jgi:hypothetical protein
VVIRMLVGEPAGDLAGSLTAGDRKSRDSNRSRVKENAVQADRDDHGSAMGCSRPCHGVCRIRIVVSEST